MAARHASLQYSRGTYILPARHGRFRRDPSTRQLLKDAGLTECAAHSSPRRATLLLFPVPSFPHSNSPPPPIPLSFSPSLPLPFPLSFPPSAPLQQGIRDLKLASGRGSCEPSRGVGGGGGESGGGGGGSTWPQHARPSSNIYTFCDIFLRAGQPIAT